ncbi:hypothetical protein [Deinococcus kurensis]|uniref:hypothetical protein n=1 Tax=Deinococcus kurensis TaxID=2662757 RepID=UPI0012D2FB25|nr:hypothetical protein [Deinococcus kurensis]
MATVQNNNLKGLDLPVWEMLQSIPATTGAGMVLAADERGTNRYIYALLSTTSFWRYCVWSNTWQQLASPPVGAVGAGTAMVVDPSRGAAGYVWAYINNGTTAGFAYYDVAVNAWTSKSVTGLPVINTDASLSHTCTQYNAAGNDDFLYLIGGNTAGLYRYSISGNTWASLTAAAATASAGCQLQWMPGWNTDRLVRVRGGGSAALDYYSISGNAWTTLTYNPSTEGFTTGTYLARGRGDGGFYIQKDSSMRVYDMDLNALTLTPQATQYVMGSSTAVVGNRMVYVKTPDGVEFLYVGLHSSSGFLRTPIYF